jgi:DNA end-binding protein Ku
VHAKCGGKLEQQFFCAADDAVVPRPAIAKQYRMPDGTFATLTEEDIRGAESDRVGTMEIVECVPEDSVAPIYFGKAMLVAPDEAHGIDAYSTFVDALEATKTAAVGLLYTRTRDQLVHLQRYRERGLLLRELFYASEMRPLDEVELPLSVRSSLPPGAFELWTDAIERRRKAAFSAETYKDGYPARLLRVAERTSGGGEHADAASPRPDNLLLKAARRRIVEGSNGESGQQSAGAEARAPAAARKPTSRGARREETP